MSASKTYTIDLQPVGRRARISGEETLLEAAQVSGVELVSLCGGIGCCLGCRVRVASGQVSHVTLEEESQLSEVERAEGYRLACQAYPMSDVILDIPPESLTTAQRLELEGKVSSVSVDPVVRPVDLHIPMPALHDLRPDLTRLRETFGRDLQVAAPVLRQLAKVMREQGGAVRLALRGQSHLVAVLPGGTALLGLAVDIGTTSLAAYLVDLASGETLAKAGVMNPQIAYGEDVISRIVYSNQHDDGDATLQRRVIDAINDLITKLCESAATRPEQIVEVVLVGNTVMHHLIAGLPVESLGHAPYVPVTHDSLELPAVEIDLHTAPGAMVYMPPLIAGFVGSDHVAMLLASEIGLGGETHLAFDIGTNTEITLAHQGRFWSCSCASGPAFEGAHISDGMRAAPGAIERVQVLEGRLHIQTIGGKAAVGICGSGILDALAVMAEHGIVDERGAMNPQHPLVQDRRFILSSGDGVATHQVSVKSSDVAKVQLAKAAIRAATEILLRHAGVQRQEIDRIVIAGAFGAYIAVDSGIRIGLFPAYPSERFSQIGNAAGMGACQLLVSRSLRVKASAFVHQIQYVELTTEADFQNEFIDQLGLNLRG